MNALHPLPRHIEAPSLNVTPAAMRAHTPAAAPAAGRSRAVLLWSVLLWTLLTATAAGTMMALGQRVEKLRDRQAALKDDIARDTLALHMLDAEWAHLNRPERLRDLALELTDLRPTDTGRVSTIAGLVAELNELSARPTAPHCSGVQPPARKPTVDSNGILLATYGLAGDQI